MGLKGVTETPLFSAARAGESKGRIQQLMLKEAAEIDKNVTTSNLRHSPAVSEGTQQHTIPREFCF